MSKESWELGSTEKKELEDVVKQKEKWLLMLQHVTVFPSSPSLDLA